MRFPLKNARFTPASRAASTFSRCPPDQYSSCPTDKKMSWFWMRLPRRSLSMPVVYVTSYPFRSIHLSIGYSALKSQSTGVSSAVRVRNGRL